MKQISTARKEAGSAINATFLEGLQKLAVVIGTKGLITEQGASASSTQAADSAAPAASAEALSITEMLDQFPNVQRIIDADPEISPSGIPWRKCGHPDGWPGIRDDVGESLNDPDWYKPKYTFNEGLDHTIPHDWHPNRFR